MLTTSSAFLKALTDAGITHAFVNWGSDHPALLEELARLSSSTSLPDAPKFHIVTCPHESVALSAAQGYAQASGRPAAVLVHVDVGTQSLGGAVHNCARGRAPVLIYAGAAPFSTEGEFKGSRNEFIFWLQDCVDQPAIVRQYMKHTAEIYSGKNVGMVVRRALQFATSEPKGPVYLWARREVMEEEIDKETYAKTQPARVWPSIQPSPIPDDVAKEIVSALASAHSPLIIASHTGRQPAAIDLLAQLCDTLAIPVIASCPTAPVLPAGHVAFAGTTYGRAPPPPQPNPLDLIYGADVMLLLDTDIPFAGGRTPTTVRRIFHIDVDPLKEAIGTFHAAAEIVCRADTLLALRQLVAHAQTMDLSIDDRRARLQEWHERRQQALLGAQKVHDAKLTVPTICGLLARALPDAARTLILNEGVSNYPLVWEHLGACGARMLASGGSSLGWGLGAAIGARLASDVELVVLVVGDGSFLFGVPGAAFWVAQNYDAPFLTIVLNNGGWKSPKLSMLGVHPSGHGASAATQASTLGVTFGPNAPDYAAIAVAAAAGNAWGRRISNPVELDGAMREALDVVLAKRQCAVLDCVLEGL